MDKAAANRIRGGAAFVKKATAAERKARKQKDAIATSVGFTDMGKDFGKTVSQPQSILITDIANPSHI